VSGITGALPIALAATGGGLLVAAARDGLAALPVAARWTSEALEPLRRAGSEGHVPTEGERRRLALIACLALPAVALLALGPGPAPLFALGGPVAAGWAVSARRRRYRRLVEAQLGAVAIAVADGLVAGRPVRSALAAAAQPLSGPSAAELARVRADLELGVPTAQALARLRERLDSPAVDSFCAAILTSHLAGGDLAGLLRRFADAANERERIVAEARGATAQARFTGLLVVGMPVGAAILAELAHPGFVASMLRSPAAVVMLGVATVLQLGGFLAIRRLGLMSAG
jgi:tight adherence protein B